MATTGGYEWNNGELTAYWPVGTAFAYSLLFRLFGHLLAPIAAVNVAIGIATLALIMACARQWVGPRAALYGGAIYALWPSQIEFTSILSSELLFNLLLLLAMFAALVAPIRSFVARGVMAGIFLAAAAYVRPTALLVPLLLAAGLVWSQRASWRVVLTMTAAACVVMAICIAPWTIRNAHLFGTPVLISTNGSPNLWMGNNPASDGSYMPLPGYIDGLSETDRATVLGREAKAFMIHHPLRTASLFARKLVITHDRETIGVVWNLDSLAPAVGERGLMALKAVSTGYWWLILLLGLAGAAIIIRGQQWRGLLHPALLTWAYFAFVHGLTVGGDRYHFPSIPFIAILAGGALASVSRAGFAHSPETISA
jgi:hypothetical protein